MKLLHDLRRRRMFGLVGLYVVGAWIIIQVADVSFPAWGVPESAMRYLFIAAAACFPVALIFSWYYDVTASGITRTQPAGVGESFDLSLRRADYLVLIALLSIGLGVDKSSEFYADSRKTDADRRSLRLALKRRRIAVDASSIRFQLERLRSRYKARQSVP